MQSYAWPGNVRELRNVLERAMLTMTEKEIRSEDLLLESDQTAIATKASGLPAADWEIRPLEDVVADYVTASVDAAGGNVRKAARLLKISPSTLYARKK
jgi:DNA-binding NtrC family response regulator